MTEQMDRLVDLQDQVEQLRELLAAAIGDRDRARSVAVALEQETAALEQALAAVTHEYEANPDFLTRCTHCAMSFASDLHLTPARVRQNAGLAVDSEPPG